MTTRADLDRLALSIDRLLSLDDGTHTVEFAYGQPRLYKNGGSREVSPRLSRPRLEEWMEAYLAGIVAASAVVRP